LEKSGEVFTSEFVGTGLLSYVKRNLPGRGLTKVEKHWFRPCIRGEVLTLFYFSQAISYKTGPTERVSLEFVVEDGICQILLLNFQRHSAIIISILTDYTHVTCISKRQSSRSLRWWSLNYVGCNHGETCATDSTLFVCRLR
jgi:hypothetical protein